MKMQKKPITDLFESWKEFCQDKITDHAQDDDNNNEQESSTLIPAKTNDKGMPRILPVDKAGHCVLPELDSKFAAVVPGFVRQEMLRSWLTYWYSTFLAFFTNTVFSIPDLFCYQGRQLVDQKPQFLGLSFQLTLRSL